MLRSKFSCAVFVHVTVMVKYEINADNYEKLCMLVRSRRTSIRICVQNWFEVIVC